MVTERLVNYPSQLLVHHDLIYKNILNLSTIKQIGSHCFY